MRLQTEAQGGCRSPQGRMASRDKGKLEEKPCFLSSIPRLPQSSRELKLLLSGKGWGLAWCKETRVGTKRGKGHGLALARGSPVPAIFKGKIHCAGKNHHRDDQR